MALNLYTYPNIPKSSDILRYLLSKAIQKNCYNIPKNNNLSQIVVVMCVISFITVNIDDAKCYRWR